jgi:hypothetical protein
MSYQIRLGRSFILNLQSTGPRRRLHVRGGAYTTMLAHHHAWPSFSTEPRYSLELHRFLPDTKHLLYHRLPLTFDGRRSRSHGSVIAGVSSTVFGIIIWGKATLETRPGGGSLLQPIYNTKVSHRGDSSWQPPYYAPFTAYESSIGMGSQVKSAAT